ncbi:hypothetical protein, partial [Mycobacterium sp.]|uniref:hypothetical protein n=1 Tax=Mycobacterium sp. TaxID=1785 RepID=UPI002D35D21C
MTGQTRGAGAATLRATCTPGVRAEPLILEDDVWSGLDADDADDAGPSEALVATIQLGGRVGAM